MTISQVRLFDDMRDINATLRQRNEIEKDLRMKSDR